VRQAPGGGGGRRFGGIWTAVIVIQVAVTVAFPAVSFLVLRDLNRVKNANADLADERYLVARLDMDREPPPTAPADTSRAAFLARYRTTIEELERRLLADESVVDVTFAERVPRMYHAWHQIEVDQGAVPPPDLRGHRMGVVAVDLDYFDVLGAPILAGRPFGTGDLAADARVVIVNRPFVDSVLGGKNPIGRRLRIVASESSREPDPTAPWHEIVGVVPDLGTTSGYGPEGVYLPARMGDHYPLRIAVHVQGDARAFAPRLMETAMRVDPTLRIEGLIRLDDVIREEMRFYTFWLRLSLGVSAVALLLSLAGIYAVMSFTVSRRTREIGIRVALGCRSSRVVPAILARPLTQIACGIAAGMSLVSFLALAVAGWTISAPQIAVVVGYAALMTGVCLIACIVPTRRALRVEPTEALRADG
jgi:putative ABC transport system permease protein